MQRLVSGLVLLAALFLTSIWYMHRLDRTIGDMLQLVDMAQEASEREDYAAALAVLQDAQTIWREAARYDQMVASHDVSDGVTDILDEAIASTLEGERGVTGLLEKLRSHLQARSLLEHARLESVF